jgi:hypothetical protein
MIGVKDAGPREGYDVGDFVPDMGDILNALRTVAYFNRPRWELVDHWLALVPEDPTIFKPDVENAVSDGTSPFEALARIAPGVADCIHDFVYSVSHPDNSIITKNLAREEVTKLILDM